MAPVDTLESSHGHAEPQANTLNTKSPGSRRNPFFVARSRSSEESERSLLEADARVNLGPPSPAAAPVSDSAPVPASSSPSGVGARSHQRQLGFFEDGPPRLWDDADIKDWIRVAMRMTARLPDKKERIDFL